MIGWTSIEQVACMAAELASGEEYDGSSSVNVTLRRVASAETKGPRWTATVSPYSSKAARTPEEAIEEVASMFRSALLCRIERAEKRIRSARAALPADPLTDEDRLRMTEGSGAALARAMAGVQVLTDEKGGVT